MRRVNSDNSPNIVMNSHRSGEKVFQMFLETFSCRLALYFGMLLGDKNLL